MSSRSPSSTNTTARRPGSTARALATLALALCAGATVQAQPMPPDGAPGPGMRGHGHGMRGHGMHGHGGLHGMRGHGGMHGPMMERRLDAVGASVEQKARIREILRSARYDVERTHDGDRELRRQLMAQLVAAQPDAAAAERLRAQLSANRDASSRRMLTAMLDAAAVLTPAQRQQLAQQHAGRGMHGGDGMRGGPRWRDGGPDVRPPMPPASRP